MCRNRAMNCKCVAPNGKFDTIYNDKEVAEKKAITAWNNRG